MKFLQVVNTAALLGILTFVGVAAGQLRLINYALWYQISLMEDTDINDYSVFQPTDEWPHWNTAVRGNPLQEDLLKMASLTKKSKCQLNKEKDLCREIAYIWRKFETLDASRAEFESMFYGHVFEETRRGQTIKPRRQ